VKHTTFRFLEAHLLNIEFIVVLYHFAEFLKYFAISLLIYSLLSVYKDDTLKGNCNGT
jgi:uncharacterized membrane protein